VEAITAGVGLTVKDLFDNPGPRSARRPRLSPMAEARREVLLEARRQPWTREDVQLRYFAADALKFADQARRDAQDTPIGHQIIALAAQLTTEAEALLADLER